MASEWANRPLGSFTERLREINVEGEELEPLSVTKGQGVVLQSSRFKKRVATDLRKYQVAHRGDFIFDPMSLYYGSVGRLDVIDEGVTSPDYVVFRADDSVDSDFLLSLLRWPEMTAVFEARSERGNRSGKRRRLYWSGFRDIEVGIPPLPEQRKIAAILSSVDEAIEKTQAVIDQVQVVKKGLMQELLTKGLPGRHKKFKQTEIGEIPEDWEVVELDSIKAPGKFSCAGGPFGSSLSSKHYTPTGVPVIRGGNLSAGHERFKAENFVFVSEEKADELQRNLAFPGDVVITQRGTLGQVGIIPLDSEYERFVVSQSQMKLTVDGEIAKPEFVYFYFRSPVAAWVLERETIATGVPHINLGILKKWPIPMPSLAEQEAIVDILEGIEARLMTEAGRSRALSDVKTALMSVLLTGELRVTP